MVTDVLDDDSEDWREVEVPLTEPQEQFVFSDYKYPAIIGGLGSGKTQAGIERTKFLQTEQPGCPIAYYMPTYDLLRMRCIPGFESEFIKAGISYTLNKNEWRIDSDLGPIFFRSYDRPERIIAYEVAHSLVDELDTLNKKKAAEVWRKVSERNRAATTHAAGNTIGLVTSPDQGLAGFAHARWGRLKDPTKLYTDDGKGKYALIRAPTYTNVCIPGGTEAYIEQIRENYDPLMAEMYIEGLFVSLTTNCVYHYFDRKKHHTSRTLSDDDKFLHVSIDFNIGGCACIVWVIDDGVNYAIKEFVAHDTDAIVVELETYKRYGRKIITYPDASGGSESTNASQSDLAIIRGGGFAVDCPKANPAVRDRVNAKNAQLSKNRIKVNTNECPHYTNALESQGYDDKGKPEKFDDHPSIDDFNDSGGYFINRKYPIVKPIISTNIRTAI